MKTRKAWLAIALLGVVSLGSACPSSLKGVCLSNAVVEGATLTTHCFDNYTESACTKANNDRTYSRTWTFHPGGTCSSLQ